MQTLPRVPGRMRLNLRICTIPLYSDYLLNTFRVSLAGSAFGGRRKSSDHLAALLKQHGKACDARVVMQAKGGDIRARTRLSDSCIAPSAARRH